MDKEYLLTFENSHNAIKAESIMKENNISNLVMPTPTVITRSCGLCIKINENDAERTKALIKNGSIKVKSTLLKTGQNYELTEL
jgi:hypothetical protein